MANRSRSRYRLSTLLLTVTCVCTVLAWGLDHFRQRQVNRTIWRIAEENQKTYEEDNENLRRFIRSLDRLDDPERVDLIRRMSDSLAE